VVPSCVRQSAGERSRHRCNQQLLEHSDGPMLARATPEIRRAASGSATSRTTGSEPFGPFLAFQFAIDLNYSALYRFSEMDFVVAGPEAKDGIAKCFIGAERIPPEDVIRAVTEAADDS
jgi:alpha-glutamyl/putrescinyl thymine pyrophosphorylase clade 1